MVIDTSAVIAIAQEEPEADRFAEIIARAQVVRMSIGNLIEAAIVIDRRGDRRSRSLFDGFPVQMRLRLEPVTEEHYDIARAAHSKYGKGRHKAALNFGDCFAYALAKATNERLLFKGNDFSQTDIRPAAV